ncbi:hypothetical protein KQH82_00145 [bacterium]|nr:hypothetical protein [bacterium]
MIRAYLRILCIALAVGMLLTAAGFAVERTMTATSSTIDQKAPPSGEAAPADQGVTKQGGDTVNDAVAITSLPFSGTGTTTGYTNDYDEVCTYTGSTAPDVVYSYSPATAEWIDLSLCQSLYDTKLYIYENTVTAGSPYACNDDACGSDGYKSQLTGIFVSPGNTYYIVVDGYGTESGTYFLDIAAGDPPPDYCPVDTTIFGQSTHVPEFAGWSAGVSDVGFNSGPLLRYENFSGLAADIEGLHFWALSAYNDGVNWSECDETPRDLQIIFYEDDAGAPGTDVATFDVTVSGTPTSFLFSGFTLDEYRVDLTTPVTLTDGWVSIQGTDASTCWFLWMSGYGLDGAHLLLSTDGLSVEAGDLSLCLLGSMGEPIGACCFPLGGCSQMTEADCQAQGGLYAGDDVPCDPDPCPCCIGFTGNINNDPGGAVDLSDLIAYVDWLFNFGAEPPCLAACNTNGSSDCIVDLSDLIYLVNYLFLSGPAPAPCNPSCE